MPEAVLQSDTNCFHATERTEEQSSFQVNAHCLWMETARIPNTDDQCGDSCALVMWQTTCDTSLKDTDDHFLSKQFGTIQ